MLPVKLSTGGFSGIATILFYVYKIPANMGMIILNAPLLIISLKVLGVKFSFKTVLGTVGVSVGISIGEMFQPLTNDILLAAIFGGLAVGLGLSLAVKGEGTTGGTDVVVRLIQKIKPHMNFGEILLIVDGAIITTSAIVFRNIDVALYSVVAVFVVTKMMDLILEGANYAKALFIVSSKPDEISKYILEEIGRGVTGLNGKGMYTKEDKEVLLCIVNKRELPKVKQKIKEIDSKSFTIVTTVTEAVGEGFVETT